MSTQNTSIALISVYGNDEPEQGMYDRRLYELLQERKPWQNISHRIMPSFVDHVAFIRSRPYLAWYAIYDANVFVGSIYLTHMNEIGLFVKDIKIGKGYGSKALNTLMRTTPRPHYLANIAPGNSTSITFFLNMGFKYHQTTLKDSAEVLQFTYKFIPPHLSCEPVEV
jgi:RimJ/RimL family protein N-acetyltransferase